MYLDHTERDTARTAAALTHFQNLENIIGQICNDVSMLERFAGGSQSDPADFYLAVNGCLLFLRAHSSDLSDICDALYIAVRRSWGYDN